MVKIKIPLPEDNLAGAEAEWVWAKPHGNDTYAINNVPFYARGISCDDIVKAQVQDGALVFQGIVRHSGHSTYRIYASAGHTAPNVAALVGTLEKMHCDIELATDKLVAVDVLPEADVYKVYEALKEAKRGGTIDFEEGHCGHPLRHDLADSS
jgi:hypothetical protein